jgi:hypothetical protein
MLTIKSLIRSTKPGTASLLVPPEPEVPILLGVKPAKVVVEELDELDDELVYTRAEISPNGFGTPAALTAESLTHW